MVDAAPEDGRGIVPPAKEQCTRGPVRSRRTGPCRRPKSKAAPSALRPRCEPAPPTVSSNSAATWDFTTLPLLSVVFGISANTSAALADVRARRLPGERRGTGLRVARRGRPCRGAGGERTGRVRPGGGRRGTGTGRSLRTAAPGRVQVRLAEAVVELREADGAAAGELWPAGSDPAELAAAEQRGYGCWSVSCTTGGSDPIRGDDRTRERGPVSLQPVACPSDWFSHCASTAASLWSASLVAVRSVTLSCAARSRSRSTAC